MVETHRTATKVVRCRIEICTVATPEWQEAGVARHVPETHGLVRESTMRVDPDALSPAVQHPFRVSGRHGSTGGETKSGGR